MSRAAFRAKGRSVGASVACANECLCACLYILSISTHSGWAGFAVPVCTVLQGLAARLALPWTCNCAVSSRPLPFIITPQKRNKQYLKYYSDRGRAVAKLYFRYSAMNAGKSTALLQVAHNYEEQGQQVKLYTAAIDNRYGVGLITSRLGAQRNAEIFDTGTNFLEQVSGIACLLVDE